ncbi:hypothetical protein GGI25_006434 [Coemansia spiralis]|uniref:25S rRNA (uridine-N(3))-methyltransferase BMT5-like domain-containing protein n=1 Tax=Coemansia spiralis TaxID=417178 RepID=A0A9W8G265_9FUNG|nr:hypothetical protein GGI26_006163 [Coemansia sp. RSA 1358]KAJ2668498.1 hypothetical protein GGI25_006434 [Coemansia spiralis]
MPKPKKSKLFAALKQAQQTKAKQDVAKRIQENQAKQLQKTQASTSKKNTKRKPIFPYTQNDTILLIGEGNFSFAHSVAQTLGTGANIVATAYDSEETVRQKYSEDAQLQISQFKALNGTVLFNVDGTALEKQTVDVLRHKKFTHIVFNFPHVGAGIKDQARNIRINQEMLMGFFCSAMRFLTAAGANKPSHGKIARSVDNNEYSSDSEDEYESDHMKERNKDKKKRKLDTTSKHKASSVFEFEGLEASVTYNSDSDAGTDHNDAHADMNQSSSDEERSIKQLSIPDLNRPGQIHVSLKSGLPYSQWNIKQLARECGLASLGTRPFDIDAFPGYEHRRTLGFKAGVSKDENEEIRNKDPKLYIFVVKQQADVKDDDDTSLQPNKSSIKLGQKKDIRVPQKGKHKMLGVNSESYEVGNSKKRRQC